MDIQIAALCDAAVDYNGKLSLLGSFDTICATQFPAIHPACSIALRMVFNRVEEGPHKLKLNLVNEDGGSIMPAIEIPLEVVFPTESSFVSRNFIINFQQLKFDVPGHYAVEVALDDRHATSVPLSVQMRPLGSSLAPPPAT